VAAATVPDISDAASAVEFVIVELVLLQLLLL
jgi:hypothetical protein